MVDLTIIVKNIIEKIDLSIPVQANNYPTIRVCKTLHLKTGMAVVDEFGNGYSIIDFKDNEWLKLEAMASSPDPFIGDFVVGSPVNYLHGTPSSVNDEYQELDRATYAKMPLIWLNENYTEEEIEADSMIGLSVQPTLFFMDAMEVFWNNEEHHRLVIKPMSNLADAFMDVMRNDRTFKKSNNPRKTPRTRFGVYSPNRGNTKRIIEDFISAVEIQPSIVKFKKYCC